MSTVRPAIIKHRDVQYETRVTSEPGQARVELLEERGVVHAISVTCSCGKVTVVELEYDDPSEGKKQ